MSDQDIVYIVNDSTVGILFWLLVATIFIGLLYLIKNREEG